MAVDEALLESTAERTDDVCTLRFYRWAEPTLSLGYFQSFGERADHAASESCSTVRRASGGGAILHHDEITYSLTTPPKSRFAKDHLALYHLAHAALIETLAERGIQAELCGALGPQRERANPFLCFQRRTEGDVLFLGNKVAGSAQRRLKGAILQHGSLLLQRSRFAPELPGIFDLAPELSAAEIWLLERWRTRFLDKLGLVGEGGELTEAERQRSEEICRGKYGADSWTIDRCRSK